MWVADTEFRFSVGVKQKNIGVDQSAVVMDTSIHTVEIPILYLPQHAHWLTKV
ncbi:hypothetical protein NTGBS_40077 [Candidatus Nitrotoga sp. BS]|nr:hypothetical protein NTGBS_40077 [Candidatus Nitrotoga sp. BS]